MTKQKNNKIKETKKIYINHRFSDTDVDPNDRWVKQFQQTFSTSSSSRTYERTVEGISEITKSKTDQEINEEFRNQYKSFKNNEDMSKSNIEKKDEHYTAIMSIQGII
jgi:hypothetical protein